VGHENPGERRMTLLEVALIWLAIQPLAILVWAYRVTDE
jgi:hypothetical protein